MPELKLMVDGEEFAGWTQIQVVRSLDSLADSFDLQLVTRGSSRPPPANLAEGDECKVLYGAETLIHGWIDEVSEPYSAASSSLSVVGRSRAGDLVDCSAVHRPWRGASILKIASDLCDPFGIAVSSDVSDLPEEKYFKLSQGETVFAALDRLARDHGMRVVSRSDGSVLFTRTGLLRFPHVVIENGVNVVTGNFRRSAAERYSDYIFKCQLAASDAVNATDASPKYEVNDAGVTRFRPLVIERDTQRGKKALQEAAEWERNTRAGKARELSYEVLNPDDPSLSWENAEGLWEPNTIVTVRDPYYEIEGEFLVVEVRFTLTSGGTRTSLRLCPPEAYEPKKPPKKKTKKRGHSW